MQQTMSLKEQQSSAAALRSQLAAGVPIAEAVERLAELQPEFETFWLGAAKDVGNGRTLSAVLTPIWPSGAISAIRAGEESGRLVRVLENLAQSIQIQRDINSEIKKIGYPLAVLAGASVVFVTILLTLVPSLTVQLQHAVGNYGEVKGVAGLGLSIRVLLVEHWVSAVICAVIGVAGMGHWIRQPATLREIARIVVDLPVLGPALYQLCFGLWARYLAMGVASGLSTIDALRATTEVLPEPMRAGVRGLIQDLAVRHLPMDRATNAKELPEADPRRKWPFFVRRAFAVAAQSGELDVELERIAPELIATGKEEVQAAVKYGYYVAMAVSAAMLASAMVLIYVPMMDVFERVN